jgi:GT2 family glycosyltransferase
MKEASGEYFLILNPDTIVGKTAIATMLLYARRNPKAGIIGPKLVNPDGSLQYSSYRFPKIYTFILRRTFLWRFAWAKNHIDKYLMAEYDRQEPREVGWIMGSCLLLKKEMIDRIGMFDERFFMYLEDTDLCRRARQAGYKVVYDPHAVVVHDHGRASAGQKWYVAIFKNKMAWVHMASWAKYFWKWGW